MKVKRNELGRGKYQPLLLALLSMVGFLAITSTIHLIRYNVMIDSALLQYYLFFGAIGALSLAVRLFSFGSIFLLGAVAGLIVDCVMSFLEGPRQTMSGGIYNILIVLLGAIIGIAVEVSVRRAERAQ
ncbi:MAG: hypothetical protein FD169_2299 [Bacillota bacterium]|nr:MAG: hypothetical protein FD169_2299 [Bacillota bacterium]